MFGFLIVSLLVLSITWFCDLQVKKRAKGRLYSEIGNIPFRKVGLLLGTAKDLKSGHQNPYYKYRVAAAAALLKADKIKYLVISGDNSRKDYNEPQMMKEDLGRAGIDTNKVFLDYAGFRTFDSMVRLREIFSQDSVTIISQQFHNERALYIAGKENINAIAFNARDVNASMGLRTNIREKFARVKVFVDYMLGVEPKFLGPKVEVR